MADRRINQDRQRSDYNTFKYIIHITIISLSCCKVVIIIKSIIRRKKLTCQPLKRVNKMSKVLILWCSIVYEHSNSIKNNFIVLLWNKSVVLLSSYFFFSGLYIILYNIVVPRITRFQYYCWFMLSGDVFKKYKIIIVGYLVILEVHYV